MEALIANATNMVPCVLIADDDDDVLEVLAEVVSDLGYETVTACAGHEAHELAKRRVPDLVITDYMMPGMTGAELARALDEDPGLARIPVILLSASASARLGTAHTFRFLRKPVELSVLRRAIEDALGRHRLAASGAA